MLYLFMQNEEVCVGSSTNLVKCSPFELVILKSNLNYPLTKLSELRSYLIIINKYLALNLVFPNVLFTKQKHQMDLMISPTK